MFAVVVPSAAAEPPGTPGLTATMANRLDDAVLGQGGVYADADRNVMVAWDLAAVDGHVFSLQVFNNRPLRLVLPAQGINALCGYGAVRIGRGGPLHDIAATADAYVECYDSAARRNGWSIDYSPCIATEHPHATTWVFTAAGGAEGCPGALTRTVKSKAGAPVSVVAPFQMTGLQTG